MKNNVYPSKLQFYYIKVGLRGSNLYRHVFVMASLKQFLNTLTGSKIDLFKYELLKQQAKFATDLTVISCHFM